MRIGLQLYSVRDEMEKDFFGTLDRVKEMGYNGVEFAGYFGHSAKEIKEYLDKVGLEVFSVHQTHDVFINNPIESVQFLIDLGAKFAAIPWIDKNRFYNAEDFNRLIAETVLSGALLKNYGITLLYHNHDFEFAKDKDGNYYLDELYSKVGSDLLQCEIDTCWVRYAGVDPSEYILKYKGRCPIVHLKDSVGVKSDAPAYALIDANGNAQKSESVGDFAFKPLGQGGLDVKGVIKAAREAGSSVLIVEQDESLDRPTLVAARESIDYLRKVL